MALENINILKDGLKEVKIDYSEAQIKGFETYKDLLLEWNEKMNLTAITQVDEVYIKHFVDSATCLLTGKFEGEKKIIDVGTGAGFPGLPIKIMRDDVKLTLLDSLNKRINFLKEVCDNIELEDVEFLHSRAEDAGRNPEYRQKYDISVSRAVANLSTLLEYCTPFVKVGGYFICQKGPSVDQELADAKKAIEVLNVKLIDRIEIKLPFTDINHNILIFEKTKDTPKKYPRQAGKPSKNPIR